MSDWELKTCVFAPRYIKQGLNAEQVYAVPADRAIYELSSEVAYGRGEFPETAEAEKDLSIYRAFMEKGSPSMAESMWDKDKLAPRFNYEDWIAGPLTM